MWEMHTQPLWRFEFSVTLEPRVLCSMKILATTGPLGKLTFLPSIIWKYAYVSLDISEITKHKNQHQHIKAPVSLKFKHRYSYIYRWLKILINQRRDTDYILRDDTTLYLGIESSVYQLYTVNNVCFNSIWRNGVLHWKSAIVVWFYIYKDRRFYINICLTYCYFADWVWGSVRISTPDCG